jgi:hypothetical protein
MAQPATLENSGCSHRKPPAKLPTKYVFPCYCSFRDFVYLSGSSAPASAQPPGILTRRYEVLVDRGGQWERHGVYILHAEVAALRLRARGHKVEIREFWGR